MKLLSVFLEKELCITNTDILISQFEKYEELLLDWNKKLNLVSRKTTSIKEHILNSIFFLTKYKLNGNENIIDIGTGGGFPGIPLKILYPEINLTLVDSIQKKVKALDDIVVKMNFKETKTVCSRAEDLSNKKNYSKKFDIVISKTVAPLDKLYKWGKSFLTENGKTICIKGGDISDEINSFERENQNTKFNVIDYKFDSVYNIEDKKIVVIL
jgi:16S rRNA (guanine527-N7)-methyltransferase